MKDLAVTHENRPGRLADLGDATSTDVGTSLSAVALQLPGLFGDRLRGSLRADVMDSRAAPTRCRTLCPACGARASSSSRRDAATAAPAIRGQLSRDAWRFRCGSRRRCWPSRSPAAAARRSRRRLRTVVSEDVGVVLTVPSTRFVGSYASKVTKRPSGLMRLHPFPSTLTRSLVARKATAREGSLSTRPSDRAPVPLPAQQGEVERSLHVGAAVDDADAGVEVGPFLEESRSSRSPGANAGLTARAELG
jgi:hypothetical protein